MDGRDALARSLYEKLFSQLVATINKSLQVSGALQHALQLLQLRC
jgi:myosin heavy subunit